MKRNNTFKISFFFIYVFLITSVCSYAQTDEALIILSHAEDLVALEEGDSAISYLKQQANTPSIKNNHVDQAILFYKLYSLYRYTPHTANQDSSIHYLKKEIALQKSDSLLHYRYMRLAYEYGYYGDFVNAEPAYQAALERLNWVGNLNDSVLAYAYSSLAKAKLDKYEEGLILVEKAIGLAFNSNNLSAQFDALNGKATYFYFATEFDKQKALMPRLLKLSKRINDSTKIYNTLSTLSNLSMMEHKFDSAEYYLLESLKYNINTSLVRQINILTELTSIQTYLGKFEEAEKNAKKMLEGYKSNGLERSEKGFVAYMTLGNLQLEQENYTEASKYFKIAYEIGKEIKHSHHQEAALGRLIRVLKENGDYLMALNYSDELRMLSDSIFKDYYEDKLAETEAKIGLTVKEKDLETANLELSRKESQQNFYIGMIIVLGLVLFGGGWAYARIKNDKQVIESQKETVEKALYEKELLLKEVHHRVKNNLQIISSILAKQSRNSDDEVFQKLMKDGQSRIHTMALVHKNLYQAEDLSAIEIRKYFLELSKNIASSQNSELRDIELEVKVDNSRFNIDIAIPLGLILNELLTNAYKYAFNDKNEGKIEIELKQKSTNGYYLAVSDNGSGISGDVNVMKSKSLGMNLVRGLVRQLGGDFNFQSSEFGTKFAIDF